MALYGREFAAVYNEKWAWYGPKMWPFLSRTVAKRSPEARDWLDLCCGTGSLLKLVAEAGFPAVGLDQSPHQLRHARQNAPAARLVRADVRSFRLSQRFDVITCMFDSLNYLTRQRDLERMFRCAARHLAERGLFIFDMNTFEGLQDNWCRASASCDEDGALIVGTSFDEKRARGRCLITGFAREGRLFRRFQEEHIERGYRAEEIAAALQRSGFVFRRYDGRTFSRPRKRSGRLIFVCHHSAPGCRRGSLSVGETPALGRP